MTSNEKNAPASSCSVSLGPSLVRRGKSKQADCSYTDGLNTKTRQESDTSCPLEVTVSSTKLLCHLPLPATVKNPIQKRDFTLKPSHQGLPQACLILPDVASHPFLVFLSKKKANFFMRSAPVKHGSDQSRQSLICPCLHSTSQIRASCLWSPDFTGS